MEARTREFRLCNQQARIATHAYVVAKQGEDRRDEYDAKHKVDATLGRHSKGLDKRVTLAMAEQHVVHRRKDDRVNQADRGGNQKGHKTRIVSATDAIM